MRKRELGRRGVDGLVVRLKQDRVLQVKCGSNRKCDELVALKV